MKTHLLAASTAALILAAPAAFAQDAGSGSDTLSTQSAGAGSGGAAIRPSDVTCREISTLDTETVAGVLYFISGYAEGERAMGGGMTSTSMGADTGASMSTDTAATAGTGAGATATTGTDTATAGTAGTGATTGTDMGAAGTDAGASTSADAGAAAGAGTGAATPDASAGITDSASSDLTGAAGQTDVTGSTAGQGGVAIVAGVPGFFQIPVEQTMVACGSEPDSRVSDVIRRQGGAGGASTAQ